MDKELLPSLARRMLFATKVILTFFIIGMLLFIDFLDLQEKNRDSRYLGLIKKVHEKTSALEFENFELERKDYVETNHPKLGKQHVAARDVLVATLNRFGAGVNWESKGSGESKNRFILMVNQRLSRELYNKLQPSAGYNETGDDDYADYKPQASATVDRAMQTFKRFANPEMTYFVKRVDEAALSQKLDSVQKRNGKNREEVIPAGDRNDRIIRGAGESGDVIHTEIVVDGTIETRREPSEEVTDDVVEVRRNPTELVTDYALGTSGESLFRQKEFNGVFLYRDTLFIEYEDKSRAPTQQMAIRRYVITLPVKIDSLLLPSTLHFARFDDDLVNGLAGNPGKQRQLQKNTVIMNYQ